MNVRQIDEEIEKLSRQRASAIKAEKKAALVQVKELIKTYQLTTGDLRGSLVKKYDEKGRIKEKASFK